MVLSEEAIGVSEAKTHLASIVQRLASGEQERAVLFKWNRPVAVLLPIEAYERLAGLEADLEQIEDALALARASAVNDGTTWTLEEVATKLDLL